MEELSLPKWRIPDVKPKPLTGRALDEWYARNLRELRASGQLERIRKDPNRRPVDARFVMR